MSDAVNPVDALHALFDIVDEEVKDNIPEDVYRRLCAQTKRTYDAIVGRTDRNTEQVALLAQFNMLLEVYDCSTERHHNVSTRLLERVQERDAWYARWKKRGREAPCDRWPVDGVPRALRVRHEQPE
jgi:hypothetical protein